VQLVGDLFTVPYLPDTLAQRVMNDHGTKMCTGCDPAGSFFAKTFTLQSFLYFARAKYPNLKVEIATMSFPVARFLFGGVEVWYALPIRSGRCPNRNLWFQTPTTRGVVYFRRYVLNKVVPKALQASTASRMF
jgi:hypothetical protein